MIYYLTHRITFFYFISSITSITRLQWLCSLFVYVSVLPDLFLESSSKQQNLPTQLSAEPRGNSNGVCATCQCVLWCGKNRFVYLSGRTIKHESGPTLAYKYVAGRPRDVTSANTRDFMGRDRLYIWFIATSLRIRTFYDLQVQV